MIISFIYDVTLFKFVDSSFPQCNVQTGVQGRCLAFTPLDSYLKLWQFLIGVSYIKFSNYLLLCLLNWQGEFSPIHSLWQSKCWLRMNLFRFLILTQCNARLCCGKKLKILHYFLIYLFCYTILWWQ